MRIRNIERKMKNLPYNQRKNKLKCVVVGDDGIGKTSMIASYATGCILGEHVPTVFDPFNVYDRNDNDPLQGTDNMTRTYGNRPFTIVDTANQESYDKQRAQSYIGCDVILMCFPVISRQKADDIRRRWFPEFLQYARSVPILLVGTKADLRMDPETIEKEGLQSIMTKEDGSLLAKSLEAQGYVECSAMEHVGLEEVFERAREIAISRHSGRSGFNAKQIVRKRSSRLRPSDFFKYLLCGKPQHKDGYHSR